jgi:shikimate kinase
VTGSSEEKRNVAATAGLRGGKLVMVGPRGAGKTAVGLELSRRIGVSFVDTDHVAAKLAGSPIEEIFSQGGEDLFRKWERGAVAEAVATPAPVIIATGGGAVLKETNRTALSEAGTVVYLKAPPEVLAARIAGSSRPPLTELSPVEEMRQLHSAREHLYFEIADVVIDTRPPVEQIAGKLAVLWSALSSMKRGGSTGRSGTGRSPLDTKMTG